MTGRRPAACTEEQKVDEIVYRNQATQVMYAAEWQWHARMHQFHQL